MVANFAASRKAAAMSELPRREIGSRQVAAILQMNRAWVNELAREGRMPGLLRKEPGGYANRGRYVFDAEVIERIARERIEEMKAALDRELPPQLPLEDSSSAADEELRAAS